MNRVTLGRDVGGGRRGTTGQHYNHENWRHTRVEGHEGSYRLCDKWE